MNDQQLIKKVNEVAENQRQQRGYIAPVDVLMEIGVLTEQNYEAWRFGKVSYLEKALDIFSFSAYKLLSRGKDEKMLYNSVRGIWRASKERVKTVEYVFGVYNSLIVAVYKPSRWYVCKDAPDKLPRKDIVLTSRLENRLFFEDKSFEKGLAMDDNEQFYLGKSIARLKVNQSAQNPITYLDPVK